MVKSVLSQTFHDWELIIVDDGSTDDTKKKIEPYLDDTRITYVWQTNQGQAAARNKAYQLSKGKYVAILDSDDYWAPQKLEKQVILLDSHPEVGLAYTGAIKVDEKSKELKEPYILEDISSNPLKALILGKNPICFSAVTFNRKFLEPEKLQEESIRCSDETITLYRVALRSGKFQYIPEPLTYYRVSSTSRTFIEGVGCYKNGRLKALDLFFKEPNIPEHIMKLRRKGYAGAFFTVAHRYNSFRLAPFKALWNLTLAFIYNPALYVKILRQVFRTFYVHLVLPFFDINAFKSSQKRNIS
jgi:glycosyltransferase involved in cell wall biosynthesis